METSFLLGWLGGTLLPLGAGWLLHRLVLRRERCFGYNRALLLLAPVVAVVLPLLPRPAVGSWLAPAAGPLEAGPAVALPVVAPVASVAVGWSPGSWLLGLYLLGVAAMLVRLAYRYVRLHRAIRHLPREPRPGYVLAYTGGRLPTSSFGRTVFWDDTADLTPAEATAVLAHELAHVQQRHSRDVLWLEVWRALLWFNPFAHLLLPALRLTHELLADWQALWQVASPADALAHAPPYPALLARLAARRAMGYSPLIQSFAFSFTLTRIAMLQNETPVRRWKQWLTLPVLAGVFLATACQSGNEPVAPKPTPTTSPTDDEAIREKFITQKRMAAEHLDSLKGPFEPGTAQQINIGNLQGRPEEVTVTVTRVKFPPRPEQEERTARGEKVYAYVEEMPALPTGGGMAAIVQQIQQHITYPGGPRQEGRVLVSFVVQADGSVGDTKVLKSLGAAYDEAVVAAIKKLPRFVPGRQHGQAVAVSFTVPVMFKSQP